jgi:hypothetical protein
MGNHYHLMLETPEPNLSRGMRDLNGRYAQDFNRRHGRVGHVFQGRFKGILVERESHLLELTRYVVLNPVRAGLVERPDQHPWSNYPETAGHRPPAPWLDVAWTLSQFGSDAPVARRRYEAFVAAGRGCCYRPWDELKGQVYLGSESFRERVAALPGAGAASPEVPRAQRDLSPRPTRDEVLKAVTRKFKTDLPTLRSSRYAPARKAFAFLARRLAATRIAEVADVLAITPWSVSRLVLKAEHLCRSDPGFRLALQSAQSLLSGARGSPPAPGGQVAATENPR